MPAATNTQVQHYADEVVRPVCEAIRALNLSLQDAKARIDDVYANLTNSPTWTDTRTDGPPRLLTPDDVLSFNTFISALIPHIQDAADYYKIVANCVRPVQP